MDLPFASRAAALALCLTTSCASEPALEALDVGGQIGPPPADLAEVARYVRAAGGLVVSASSGATTAETPVRLAVTADTFAQYEIVSPELTTRDPMGSPAPATMRVFGSNGRQGLVDADCRTSTRYVFASAAPIPSHRSLAPAQDGVYFLLPTAERDGRPSIPYQLYWFARSLDATTVSGAGTASGAAVAIDALRLPPD
jgi:hypothetical protein